MADYALLDPSSGDCPDRQGPGPHRIDLTTELGLRELRSRFWFLDPGDALNFHRQAEQEELYHVVAGPGRMRVEDDYLDVPEGAVVRVAPATRRQVLNDTDDGRHVWLITGAPPVADDGRPISMPESASADPNGETS